MVVVTEITPPAVSRVPWTPTLVSPGLHADEVDQMELVLSPLAPFPAAGDAYGPRDPIVNRRLTFSLQIVVVDVRQEKEFVSFPTGTYADHLFATIERWPHCVCGHVTPSFLIIHLPAGD